MPEIGIENLSLVVDNGVAIANAIENLRKVDRKQLMKEVADLSESELRDLAAKLGALDLSDQALEEKIKYYIDMGVPIVAYVLRLIKLILPGV